MDTRPSLLTELDALPTRWDVHGTLAAPVEAVAALLLAVAEGRVGDDNLLILARAAAAQQGAMTVVAEPGVDTYRAELAGPVEPVEIQVDRAHARVAVQSWYAGVHHATACPAGTRVTHRVLLVLPEHPGFTAGIAEIGLHARMTRDLRRVLEVIADRLGCPQPILPTRAESPAYAIPSTGPA
ncbi:hypothetical protein K2224_17100 [Streptomyces sp. BHT-5-2]|uniref:hypothetical protein n=1 Tax=Streptomyces sp. BHT-5-2 TaxID=2866715 RepID=UPI001C8DF43B|nr:hypothetical protein [Streptomyces sp. BHT-5-2]QZL04655.1 hypothetical protein K2224_17100 [Streptomyces sp. BHT-5-2]